MVPRRGSSITDCINEPGADPAGPPVIRPSWPVIVARRSVKIAWKIPRAIGLCAAINVELLYKSGTAVYRIDP